MAATIIQSFAGQVDVRSNLTVNTDTLHVDSVAGRVGIGKTDPAYEIDVDGTVNATNVYVGDTINATNVYVGDTINATNVYVGSNLTVNTDTLHVDSVTGRLGIGTNTPAYTLDIIGDINLSGKLYQGASSTSLWSDGVSSLYYRSNVEVGTANLFVDTTTGNTGIGTTTPAQTLEVSGTMRVSNVTDFNTRADMYVYQVDNPWIYDPKFENPNPVANDRFGSSVSMSSDGDTFVVGAYVDDTPGVDAGTAWVYMWDGVSTWNSAQLTHPSPSAYDFFGHSVAISGDGNTVIVGAKQDNVTVGTQGSAWIFRRNGLVWTRETNPLVNSNPGIAKNFGNSVSLSSDGNTAIVGEVGVNTGAGSAWIFTYSGGTWTQLSELTVSGLVANEFFGHSVAISGDGNTAIVGAYRKDTNAGASYIFRWNGSTWSEQTKLVAPTGTTGSYFGYSVAISLDGNMVVVGGIAYESGGVSNAGAAWVYKYTGGSWDNGTELIQPNPQIQDEFGRSVSMSSDENTIAVGAYHKDFGGTFDVGSVFIFRWNSDTTSWDAETNPIVPATPITDGEFGSSIGLASDGTTMVVGTPGDTVSGQSKAGSVSVWRKPDSTKILNVNSAINVTNVYVDGVAFNGASSTSLWSDGVSSLYYRSNVEVGTANLFVDTTTGNTGIGTTTPSYPLHVIGNIYGTGNITAYSDKRAKSDIVKIENALDKIDQLNGYTYTMNDERYTGLIAQEVLPVLPEAVVGSEETSYAIAYGNMMGLVIEAIKELRKRTETQ